MGLKLKDICRICLCNALEMHSVNLFYKITPDKTASDVIKMLTGYEIPSDDPLPKFLCLNCYQTIIFVEYYSQLIVNSELYLKKMLFEQQVKVKSEPPDEEASSEVKDIKLEIDIKEEPLHFDDSSLEPNIDIKNEPINWLESVFNNQRSFSNSKSKSRREEYKIRACKLCGKYLALVKASQYKMNIGLHCKLCWRRKYKRIRPLSSKHKLQGVGNSPSNKHVGCLKDLFVNHKGDEFAFFRVYDIHFNRPFGCGYCPKKFKYKHCLYIHISSHLTITGESRGSSKEGCDI